MLQRQCGQTGLDLFSNVHFICYFKAASDCVLSHKCMNELVDNGKATWAGGERRDKRDRDCRQAHNVTLVNKQDR